MFILLGLFLMVLTGGGFLLSLGVMIRAALVWKTSLTARMSLFIVLAGYALYFGGGFLMKFSMDSEGSESILTELLLVVTLSSPALCWLAAALSGADWLNIKLTDYFRGSVEPPNAWPPPKPESDER